MRDIYLDLIEYVFDMYDELLNVVHVVPGEETIYTNEQLQRLIKCYHRNPKLMQQITVCTDIMHNAFIVTELCEDCGREIIVKYNSKTKFLDRLNKHKEAILCDNCREVREYNQVRQRQAAQTQYKIQHNKNLEALKLFFSPDIVFNADIKELIRELRELDCQCSEFSTTQRKQVIYKIGYYNYLKTMYWKCVRHEKLKRAQYKCELCGKQSTLNVHHKTYEHLGNELNNLNSLIVLCSDCHNKFHDKLANSEESNNEVHN